MERRKGGHRVAALEGAQCVEKKAGLLDDKDARGRRGVQMVWCVCKSISWR